MFERNRSKAVELLARFKDHATGAYYKGFRMLTMGWSDGHTFWPVDFALLNSSTSVITGKSESIDKRTHGYKRRQESFQPAPQAVAFMLDRALTAEANASYVLMDSWFTHAPLIREVVSRGLDNCSKSLLRLQKEFQGRSYDLLISHTTIVFTCYLLLA